MLLGTFTLRREFHLPSLEHAQTGHDTDALDAETLELLQLLDLIKRPVPHSCGA